VLTISRDKPHNKALQTTQSYNHVE